MMLSLSQLLIVFFSGVNYITNGAAQQINNGSLYIPSVPSVGGLEPGEVIEAELLGTEDGTSTFRLFDSVPTVVSGSQSREFATFTLVSAPSAVLLTGDFDREIGSSDIREDIHVQCFIDQGGTSICENIIIEALDQQKAITTTSLFSETTSAVPVIAVGFGSTSSVTTLPTSSASNILSTATFVSSVNSSAVITPSPSPVPTLASNSSDGGVKTLTITSTLDPSPTDGSPFSSSSASARRKLPMSLIILTLTVLYCSI